MSLYITIYGILNVSRLYILIYSLYDIHIYIRVCFLLQTVCIKETQLYVLVVHKIWAGCRIAELNPSTVPDASVRYFLLHINHSFVVAAVESLSPWSFPVTMTGGLSLEKRRVVCVSINHAIPQGFQGKCS